MVSVKNIPLIFIAGDSNGSNCLPLCSAFGQRYLHQNPTRGNNRLDVILSNAPNCYSTYNMKPLGMKSDHDIIIADPLQSSYVSCLAPVSKIKVRSGKIDEIIAELQKFNWDTLLPFIPTPGTDRASSIVSMQSTFNILYSAIQASVDLHQPLKTVKVKNDKEWMTGIIKKLIKAHSFQSFSLRRAKFKLF